MTTIPMQIDDKIEKNEKQYIKILDNKTAELISKSGFLYMKEKFNANQELYVFEKTEELENLLIDLGKDECFSEACIVEDDTLLF